MIEARFYRREGGFHGVEITGHAGYAEEGRDIVCASVTSAVQLVCNGVTEVLKVPASVAAEENLVKLTLPEKPPKEALHLLQALFLHLELLRDDYPEFIKTTVVEV